MNIAGTSDPGEARPDRTAEIRRLNDELRRFGRGGRTMMTAGVAALPPPLLLAVQEAMRAFNSFGPDNDPYGEHDFGTVEVGGVRAFWKIDTFDLTLQRHSPDASDPAVTCRVLVLMLADEY